MMPIHQTLPNSSYKSKELKFSYQMSHVEVVVMII